MFKKSLLLLIILTLSYSITITQSSTAKGDTLEKDNTTAIEPDHKDKIEQERLLKILEKHTDIVTKSKLNADFVPGMVTVLYGDELEARGIRTVWEAMRLVPGIDVPIENIGGRDIMVRGVADTFNSGNTKIHIDNICMNITLYAEAAQALQIPIEQVEQIEVIRGPGSAIHGEYAFTSVVNIVTRKKGNRIFGNLGRFDTYGGGGTFSWSSAKRDLHLSMNIAKWSTDGEDVQTGPDSLYNYGMEAISNAPGPANEGRTATSAFFTLNLGDFEFIAQYLENKHGDYFNVTDILSRSNDQGIYELETWALEARQKLLHSPTFKLDLKAGFRKHEFEINPTVLFPPGFALIYRDGIKGGFNYEELKFNCGIDLIWNRWDKHTILLSWSLSRIDIGDDTFQEGNFHPTLGIPLPSIRRFEGEQNYIDENKHRLINSLTFQDEFQIHNQFTLTIGLRYDHYDDVDNNLSPRFAGVWRITDNHILKFQYSRAFRPPTFFEMYAMNNPIIKGDPRLDSSTIDNLELGYIYKNAFTIFRMTLFYSYLDDLVVMENRPPASNTRDARLKGIELEIEQNLGTSLKLDGNISYTDTENRDTRKEINGAANWLANISLLYQPKNNITLNLQYRYVGKRNRAPSDTRDKLGSYSTLDVTGSVFDLGIKGFTLRAGIRNLFNEDVRDPAPENTYSRDYPRPGRQWWMQVLYQF